MFILFSVVGTSAKFFTLLIPKDRITHPLSLVAVISILVALVIYPICFATELPQGK